MKQQISLMHDMAEAIENEDEAALESIESRAESLRSKMDQMDLSDGEKKRLAEKYKDDIAEATKRVMTATMSKAMGQMGKAMMGGLGGDAMPASIPATP